LLGYWGTFPAAQKRFSLFNNGGIETGGIIDTLATAALLGSTLLLTVTRACSSVATEGAVKKPSAETLPALADQVTAVLLASLTEAVNCKVSPAPRVVPGGNMAMLETGVSGEP
jgi:hypothetical protein